MATISLPWSASLLNCKLKNQPGSDIYNRDYSEKSLALVIDLTLTLNYSTEPCWSIVTVTGFKQKIDHLIL